MKKGSRNFREYPTIGADRLWRLPDGHYISCKPVVETARRALPYCQGVLEVAARALQRVQRGLGTFRRGFARHEARFR